MFGSAIRIHGKEFSRRGGVKNVEKPIDNFSGFYGKGDKYGYVDISANLSRMLSPISYKVIFYAEETKENAFWTADLTKWVFVPPPQFVISMVPTPINVRAGDSATVDVRVNSSQGLQPTVHLYTTNESQLRSVDSYNCKKSTL